MIVVYSVLSPHFLTVSNFTNVLVQCSPLLILAAGQTFPILMGGLDLSQGSIVSLVSVVTAGVMLDHGLGLATIAHDVTPDLARADHRAQVHGRP